MKLTSFHITLLVILLTSTFQSSCNTRTSEPNVQAGGASPVSQTVFSDDEKILKEVQDFAASDERASDSAWQTIRDRDRSKLIEGLTRISNASAPDDRNRVLIAFTFCNFPHEYASNRKIVLSALSRNPPFKQLFGDWAVSLVRRLMNHGDHELLVPLLDVSEWSDGAMSAELARAYSEILVSEPETFLRMLSSRPEQTRGRVIELLKDNTLTSEESTKLKSYLRNVPRKSKLRPVAERTLAALID